MALFITIEGPEGSGKTTACKKLVNKLEAEGFDILYTREPGGSQIAEQIRKIILSTRNTKMNAGTEALLYAAARRQHLVERIKPALADNKIVICDRYIDSSLAYQGFARGLGYQEVLNINLFATEGILPDLTIYFDIDAKKGLERISRDKRREKNRLDLEKIEFHNKVCDGYRQLIKKFPKRIKPIDASQEQDQVYSQLEKLIYAKIKGSKL
jgi:dTMP kinase